MSEAGETVGLTLTSSRAGCYAHCSCGYRSPGYVTVMGAHLAYGEHLAANHGPTAPAPASDPAGGNPGGDQ